MTKDKLEKMKKKMRDRFQPKGVEFVPPVLNDKGNPVVTLEKDGESKIFEVKYLVAENFVPNPENKPFVIHKDGDKLNNRAENLAWSDVDED